MSGLMAAALACAAEGWPVFPCLPGAKTPAGPLVPNGCKDATTDGDRICYWWLRMPAANVAVSCGAPGPDVVDFDCKNGALGMVTLGRLQRAGMLAGACRLVRTPSGGVHLYYHGSGQGNGRLRDHGVDFRSAGGYVVAPPSIVDGRAYEETDTRDSDAAVDFTRIRRLLDPPQPPRAPTPTKTGDWSGLVAHVARQQEGNRNDCLYWAACEAAKEDAPDATFAALVEAGVSTGLTEIAARKTVASARFRFGGRR